MILIEIVIFYFVMSFVSGDMLSSQNFGPGYPKFHKISIDNGKKCLKIFCHGKLSENQLIFSGVFKCGDHICPKPPYFCEIKTESDQSLANLLSLTTCRSKDGKIQTFNHSMKSPNPERRIIVITSNSIDGEEGSNYKDET